jgi:hypothetical protein
MDLYLVEGRDLVEGRNVFLVSRKPVEVLNHNDVAVPDLDSVLESDEAGPITPGASDSMIGKLVHDVPALLLRFAPTLAKLVVHGFGILHVGRIARIHLGAHWLIGASVRLGHIPGGSWS